MGPDNVRRLDFAGRRRKKSAGKGDEPKRLFFAIDLPGDTIASAERLIASFGISSSRVRWVHPKNMHLTLKFLGDVEEGAIAALCKAGRETVAGFEPFELTIEGIGLFPNQTRPRVLWFGAGGATAQLARLEGELAKHLEPLGFPADERPFTAHLTIGRVKSDSARGELVRLVHKNQKVYVGDAPVDALHLYESRLNPGGSIYTRLESFPLE